MRSIRFFLVLTPILLVAGLVAFFLFRARDVSAYGPAVALCPGPDLYGYSCDSAAGFAYINATIDTFLYQDDGVVSLDLPFPFTFYGTTYTQVNASSNGNLQFATQSGGYANNCLDEGPVAAMGDMIAPYWDDLDLTFYGFLKYDTVGETPDRIFVVEWQDVSRYGNPDDRVTFSVQLFEGSNDIVFFYQNVTTFEGHNGGSATIGLQSAAQGLSLQYSCNQPVVTNASALLFSHPDNPNEVVTSAPARPLGQPVVESSPTAVKGDTALLIEMVNERGRAALPQLHRHWLSQAQPRHTQWQWADVTGNGRDELILLMYGRAQNPELTRLTILTSADDGQMTLLLSEPMSTRQLLLERPLLHRAADITGDNVADVMLYDSNGRLFVISAATGQIDIHLVPDQCQGDVGLRDMNGDGRLNLVRSGCMLKGPLAYTWDGVNFVPAPQEP